MLSFFPDFRELRWKRKKKWNCARCMYLWNVFFFVHAKGRWSLTNDCYYLVVQYKGSVWGILSEFKFDRSVLFYFEWSFIPAFIGYNIRNMFSLPSFWRQAYIFSLGFIHHIRSLEKDDKLVKSGLYRDISLIDNI